MIPKTIRWRGMLLTLLDPTPCVVRGGKWYTYHVDGDNRLWEYCPADGRIVQTQFEGGEL
jgi:hypothetical protein